MAEFYKENQKIIRFYIICAMLLSVLAGFSMTGRASAVASDAVSLGNYGGFTSRALNDSFARTFGLSIDPSYCLAFSSLLSILRDNGIGTDLMQSWDFGLCDFMVVRIISVILAAFAFFCSFTKPGNVIQEKFETKYVGLAAILIIEFLNNMGYFSAGSVNAAAVVTTGVVLKASAGSVILNIILSFLKYIFILPVWFFVRFFFFAISAVSSLVLPGGGASGKFMRAGFIFLELLLKEKFPVLFYIQYAILFIISVIFFEWAFRTVRYFDSIYLKPVIHKIFRRKRKEKRLKGHEDSKITIPVFALMSRRPVRTRKRELWWLVCDDSGSRFIRKRLFRKKEKILDLDDLYVYRTGIKGFDCYEILKVSDADKKATGRNKLLSFVFSREYSDVADKLISEYGIKDYSQVKACIKNRKELERELKKAQILSRIPFRRRNSVTD